MKKLILHIGANKTGSTAIQEFLRLNAGALPALGFTVAPADLKPDGAVTGQQVWLIEELRKDMAAGRRRVSKCITELMTGVPDGGALVISAENLSNSTGVEQVFASVAGQHDMQLILYIRRQDELLLSSWQQWESKVGDDFWAWLILGVGQRGDWAWTLRAWEKIVPREQITVRLYDRAHMPDGDVVTDFAEVLGLAEHLPQLARPPANVNPSYSEALVDLVKGNTAVFEGKHDNDFYNVVEQLTGGAYHRRPRESLITHEQRLAILERYRDSNRWVRETYFPELRGPLFAEPGPDDYTVLGKDKLTQQKWEIVASLIYRLSKRVLS